MQRVDTNMWAALHTRKKQAAACRPPYMPVTEFLACAEGGRFWQTAPLASLLGHLIIAALYR